jgi:hypothetical protein
MFRLERDNTLDGLACRAMLSGFELQFAKGIQLLNSFSLATKLLVNGCEARA